MRTQLSSFISNGSIQRPGQRVPRRAGTSYPRINALLLLGGIGDGRPKISTTLNLESLSIPSDKPLSDLDASMKLGEVRAIKKAAAFTGRCLKGCTIAGPTTKDSASIKTSISLNGTQAPLHIYSVMDASSLDTSLAADLFPQGLSISIKQPYVTIGHDKKSAIRIDDPANLAVSFRPFDSAFPPAHSKAAQLLVATGAELVVEGPEPDTALTASDLIAKGHALAKASLDLQAAYFYRAAVLRDPANVPAWSSLAAALLTLRDLAGAFRAVEKALALSADDSTARKLQEEIVAAMGPPVTADALEVKPSPLGGLGLFAARDISAGECLFEDLPLATSLQNSAGERTGGESPTPLGEVDVEAQLLRQLRSNAAASLVVSRLSGGASMCRSPGLHLSAFSIAGAWREVLAAYPDAAPASPLAPLLTQPPPATRSLTAADVLQKVKANGFPIANKKGVLVPSVASLLNHSHVPNAGFEAAKEGEEARPRVLRALKPIQQGEEFLVSYTSAAALLPLLEAFQSALDGLETGDISALSKAKEYLVPTKQSTTRWGFACSCSFCATQERAGAAYAKYAQFESYVFGKAAQGVFEWTTAHGSSFDVAPVDPKLVDKSVLEILTYRKTADLHGTDAADKLGLDKGSAERVYLQQHLVALGSIASKIEVRRAPTSAKALAEGLQNELLLLRFLEQTSGGKCAEAQKCRQRIVEISKAGGLPLREGFEA